MSLRRSVLDVIAKITTPTFTEPTTRVFIFDEWEGLPGFVSVYIGKQGKSILLAHEPILSFTRARYPRRDPHIVTLQSGEEWQLTQGGCGCGSPIRRLSIRQALTDHDNNPFPVAQPVAQPVGG